MSELTLIEGLPAIKRIETSYDMPSDKHFEVEFMDGKTIAFWVRLDDYIYAEREHGTFSANQLTLRVISEKARLAYEDKYGKRTPRP